MLVVEQLLGLRAAGGVYVALGSDDPRPRGMVANDVEELGQRLLRHRPARPRGLPGEARLGARAHPRDRRAACAAASCTLPGPLRLERRLQVPVDLQERPVRELTPEQQRAVERRDGSLLVRAGAGTGKTTVLVERFVRAVTEDGVGVEQMLAITFTEKAAAEMRTRVRRRFLELGRREDARAAESAWVSTIHGFCARMLRAHALSAGIDPDFRVLDELEAERLAADAFDGALEDFMGDGSAPSGSRWWPPTRPTACATWSAPPTRTCAAAASATRASRSRCRRARRASASGSRRRPGPRWPSWPWRRRPTAVAKAIDCIESARARSRAARRRRSPRRRATSTARRFAAHRDPRGRRARAPRPHDAARAARAVRRALRAAKRERSGLDFEDLELVARDLLARHEGLREAYSSRFEHVLVDEFQDTNRLQNELLELLSRDNLFRVGDENQSIYRFRNADVGVFREHWERARGGRARGEHHRELPRARRDARRDRPRLRAHLGRRASSRCARRPGAREPAPRTSPCVDLLVVDRASAAGRTAGGRAGPVRRGDARGAALARRRGAAAREARRRAHARGPWSYGDVVMLFRATTAMGLFERALDERGHPGPRGGRARLLGPAAGGRPAPLARRAREPARRPRALLGARLAARGAVARRGRADRAARAALRARPVVGAERRARARRRRARRGAARGAARRGPARAWRRSPTASRPSAGSPARSRSRR